MTPRRPPNAPPRRPSRRRAMTIIELLLALTMTVIVGGTVAMLMVVTSYGTSHNTEIRSAMVRGNTIEARLAAACRSAAMILDHGDNHLVLWLADADGEGEPDLSELLRIEYSGDTGRITGYEAPANLAPASDTHYALATTNFDAVTAALAGGSTFPGEVWGRGVTAWQTALDNASTQLARSVSFRFTVADGGTSEAVVGAAGLRN